MSEEDSEPKRVVCLNCGHVWETTAKRPQCSICKSTRVEDVDSADVDQHVESESTSEKSNVDDFFELDDSAIDELIKEDKPKKKGRKKKEHKEKDRTENREKKGFSIRGGLKAVGSKVGSGVILIGVGVLFLLFILRGIAARKSRKVIKDMGMDIQEEKQGFDPYSALG